MTETNAETKIEGVAVRYVAAWNEPDAGREQFRGYVFELMDNVDAHHDVVRFGWELVPEWGGESVVVGFDVAVVAEEGRLRSVYGFLDKVPAA